MKRYLMNGFMHLYGAIKRADNTYAYDFLFPEKHGRWDWLTNYLLFRKWKKQGKLKEYDIVHINVWENLLQYGKQPGQLTIAEAHGFFVGVNFDATIRELPIQKRIPNKILKFIFDNKMKRKLQEYDLFYVATPNMIEHAKKIRQDAIWLPNPIDTSVFTPDGPKIKLEGKPSIFLPTRLHAFKNPLVGINLFKRIKQKYPDAKLHMINYGSGADPLFNVFRKMVDQKDVVFHERMPREELTKYYRSADLVLGQFNPGLANLSMVELEAMACGAPIVTLDKYELKGELESLDSMEKLAFRLLEDKLFKHRFVKRNLEYVRRVHGEKAVAQANLRNISAVLRKN